MSSDFLSLGLTPEIARAVADEGYTTPTPIQTQAIPLVLAGRDVLAAAQTGTGKTAGFALPLLQRLSQKPSRPGARQVRALVLTPTRELAAQVEEACRTYGRHLHLRSTLIYGGVGINPQIAALKPGVDLLVATPGRLLDHAGQKTVDLSAVEILVLDEADRMLDMGFIHDIKRVLKLLPAKKQTLLFSATFSDEIRSLAEGLLHDPASVEVARRNADSELVSQVIHPIAKGRKRDLLRDLINDGRWEQVLVFTRMKHGANRLAEQLNKDGITAAAIHGNKSQSARTKALAGFKSREIRVLVATDIAARGLDIEQLPHVVNYELPNVPEDYVHRIGRTGRAGSPGHAVSLVSADEMTYLKGIERLLKKQLHQVVMPGYEGSSTSEDSDQDAGRPRRDPRSPRPRSPAPSGGQAPRGQDGNRSRKRGDGGQQAAAGGAQRSGVKTAGSQTRSAPSSGNAGPGSSQGPRGGKPSTPASKPGAGGTPARPNPQDHSPRRQQVGSAALLSRRRTPQ